ncbi:uncharacterized protein LOC142319350 isoform X2 [Lycorma delicatula]|uniref:uncharacterized protein LOC142319350 isoform X2 n=1 Tax=Lycorma delicatula TaxID=130591 RepID=UPI003F511F37
MNKYQYSMVNGTDFRMKRSYICPKCDRQKQLLLNPRQRTIKIGAIEDIGIGAKINKTGNIGSNKFLRFENFINHLSKNKNKNDSYEIGAINNILTGSKVNKTGIIGNNTMVVHGNTGNSSSGRIKGNFRFGTMKNIATNSNITNMGKVVGGKIIQVPSKK